MRFPGALLLILATPVAAQQPATGESLPHIPQPVVLDWGDQFRLYAPPKNVGADALKQKAAEEERERLAGLPAPPSRASVALGPNELARDRYSSRETAVDQNRLGVRAPAVTGPVSVGASYGKYRAIPAGQPNREVSADDMRVSVGIAF
jgi:hypothetical protein